MARLLSTIVFGALLLGFTAETKAAATTSSPTGAIPAQASTAEAEVLIGAWRIVDAKTLAPNGEIFPGTIQHSLLLFDGRHYSINWAGGDEPSPFYAERFAPTEEEMLERYKRLVFNAGTYTVEGNVLRVRPDVALVPEFTGGEGVFEIRLDGKRIELTWIDNFSVDGVQDPYVEVGVRWQYTLERIDDGHAPRR